MNTTMWLLAQHHDDRVHTYQHNAAIAALITLRPRSWGKPRSQNPSLRLTAAYATKFG